VISRLPRWVEVGGFWLACMAGATNAVGFLGFEHEAVSHLTGTSTMLGVAATDQAFASAAHLAGIVLSFFLGAAAAGVIVGRVPLQLGRRYGWALLLEAALLCAAMVVLMRGSTAGHHLASAACGLQNGMVSSYSGAVVRTTHVSGLVTDLGTMLGASLRGERGNRRQATLYLLLLAGFLSGAVLGAVLYGRAGFLALLFPAVGVMALAAAHWGFVRSTPAPAA
jgi:uncharacterized membrane protein YoaK (UPF0700 family)